MRQLTDHKVNGLNEAIIINVVDEPGPGGANHQYEVVFHADTGAKATRIHFQNGPVNVSGVNGISNESLLAVVIDRMRGFQKGKFACEENANALSKMEEALEVLKKRTSDRVARGVEGTMEK